MDQGFNSCIRIAVDLFKSKVGKDPVLACHGNNISSDGNCNQVNITVIMFFFNAEMLSQCSYQFKTNTTSAKFFVGVITVFLFGVKNSDRSWYFFIGQMMIANNKINT